MRLGRKMDLVSPKKASSDTGVSYRLLLGLAWAGLAIALASHFWAANRGLEMADEGSYYLLALDPWKTMGHGSLHGFLLHPLYFLTGQSVAGLRIMGFIITTALAARFCGSVFKPLGENTPENLKELRALAFPLFLVSSLTYMNAGSRSPCYNWLVHIGGMLVWSGWFCARSGAKGSLETAFGLFLVFMGKWSSLVVLIPLMLLVSWFSDWRAEAKRFWICASSLFFLATAAFLFFYVGCEALVSTWITGKIFQETTRTHGFYLLSKYRWEILYYVYRIARVYLWLLPAILLFWGLSLRGPKSWSALKISTILFAVGLSLAVVRGWWRGGYHSFGKESVLAGAWLLGVTWAAQAASRNKEKDGSKRTGKERRWSGVGDRSSILLGLILTPFLLGFGTATSIADYAGQGTVFFVAAGVLMLASLPPSGCWLERMVPVVSLVGLCLLQSSRVSTSLLDLCRVGSVFSQTTRIDFGPEKDRFWADPNLVFAVNQVGVTLARAGFRPGDPVIGVDGLCGLVYLLGAKSPEACWFFEGQGQYLQRMVARIPSEKLQHCWVIQRSSTQIPSPFEWHPDPNSLKFLKEVPVILGRGPETISIFSARNHAH